MIIGPVLARAGAYAFSVWSPEAGLRQGYAYRRIEDAYYARRAALDGERRATGCDPVVCATLEAFQAEIAASAPDRDDAPSMPVTPTREPYPARDLGRALVALRSGEKLSERRQLSAHA
jgi:hypothetical protein